MDLQDLLTSAKTQSFDKFEQKLDSFVRHHYSFQNLNEANRQVVLDIIKKRLPNIHNGTGISDLVLRQEMYHLFEHRIELNLTEGDLKDIKEILELFKK